MQRVGIVNSRTSSSLTKNGTKCCGAYDATGRNYTAAGMNLIFCI